MSFGKNLATLRKAKTWTQEDLAKKSSIHISQIRKYETDKSAPTSKIVAKLAIALGVSSDELIFDKGKGVATIRILDKELLDKFEKILILNEDDIKTLKNLMDALIIKHQVTEIANTNIISEKKSKTEKPWAQRFREITDRLAKGAKNYSEEEIDKTIDEAVTAVREKEYAHA